MSHEPEAQGAFIYNKLLEREDIQITGLISKCKEFAESRDTEFSEPEFWELINDFYSQEAILIEDSTLRRDTEFDIEEFEPGSSESIQKYEICTAYTIEPWKIPEYRDHFSRHNDIDENNFDLKSKVSELEVFEEHSDKSVSYRIVNNNQQSVAFLEIRKSLETVELSEPVYLLMQDAQQKYSARIKRDRFGTVEQRSSRLKGQVSG